MDKSVQTYLRKVQKGIWSPFLRKRIRTEILDHLHDISQEHSISLTESLKFLGGPEEANGLYKNLLYKKLKHDLYLYGGSLVGLFIVGIVSIHQEVEKYQKQSIANYLILEKKYKSEVMTLNHFKRTKERKNASDFMDKLVDSNGKILDENFLSKINEFDYWETSEMFNPKMMIQLAKFAHEQVIQKKDPISQKNYQKLAHLIYSTETMTGYRLANRMLDGTLLNEKAKRVSSTTMGLLNLRPSVIAFEKTFKDTNYFSSGFCHHAQDFWHQDAFFKEVTKSNFPGERNWNEVLESVNRIKTKMKLECRLSFLKHVKEPSPMSWDSIYVKGPEDHMLANMSDKILVSISTVPYLRNVAGRYLVDKASIGIQGDGDRVYSN